MTSTAGWRLFERALFGAGIGLGLWCAVITAQAWRTARTPVPPAPARATGDIPRGVVIPARGGWVARLDAPSVGLSATVLEGSDDATLGKAAGHIEYTPLPGQRGNTNVGIAGHRDSTFQTVRHLKKGDPLELTTATGVYRYAVTATFIVDPEDVYVLDPIDHPVLTLVTCYPFDFIGHAPRRYIIQAALLDQVDR